MATRRARHPGGLPKSVFDDLQAQLAANRSVFYRALPAGPLYGFNRPGAQSSEAIIENRWRQGGGHSREAPNAPTQVRIRVHVAWGLDGRAA